MIAYTVIYHSVEEEMPPTVKRSSYGRSVYMYPLPVKVLFAADKFQNFGVALMWE